MSAPGVMVIGFDAMDASLAHRLCDAGRMPNLTRVLSSGTTAVVRNPEGLVVGGVWPSFATGHTVAGHGFYCFRQLIAGTYEIRRFTPWDIDVPPFWDVLSDAGRRCAVIDVPLTRPSDRMNGVQLVDWGSHDRMLSPCSAPDGAFDELVERHGAHPIAPRCDDYARRGDWHGLLDSLRAGVRAHVDLSLEVLAREPWDLFTVVFSESHCAGHQFWGLHEPDGERFDPGARAALAVDPLEAVYEACDEALGDLLAVAEPDTQVMVVLSHGIGSHHDGDHLLRDILAHIEQAHAPRPQWRRAREAALRAARRAGCELEARRGTRPAHPAVTLDGSRPFFQVPNNELYGGIRINVRGREPRGFIEAGQAYEAILDMLSQELLQLTDPATARPLVQRVLRTDDLHRGRRRSWLPDLLVDWERSAPIIAATSPTIGLVTGSYDGVRSGDHRPSGLVAAMGPGIEAGGSAGTIRMWDLAPTICEVLGVALPGTDGDVVPALVAAQR